MLCVCVLFQICVSDMDKPVFQAYPSELIFRNFTPEQTYKLHLHLHNNDKVCICVRVCLLVNLLHIKLKKDSL